MQALDQQHECAGLRSTPSVNVRALEQQTESKCVPYSNTLTECEDLTATEPEDVWSLQQRIGRMCRPYSNKLVGCAGLKQQIERINRPF